MKLLLLIATLIVYNTATAQVATINDPDGYTYLWKDHNKQSKVIDTLKNGDVFLSFDENKNDQWVEIWKDGTSGYIHRSRYILLENLPQVKDTIRKTTHSKLIANDTIRVVIKDRPFDKTKHKLKQDAQKHWMIDGDFRRCVEQDLPKTEMVSLTVIINNKPVKIPAKAYNDIYNASIENMNVYTDKNGYIYLYMPMNCDASLGYDVAWVLYGGAYHHRYIDAP